MRYFASPGSLNPIVKVWPNIQPVSSGNSIYSRGNKKKPEAKKEGSTLVNPGLTEDKSVD
jgi:hypothetical protein